LEIKVKSAKVLKRGENDYGPWALVKIVTDKEVEYTTLAKEADGITAGMSVVIDELSIEEKDGKEKRGFKKFEIVGDAPAPAPATQTPIKPDMTPDMWAEKDRLERWSRECNTCFMGITELRKFFASPEGRYLEVYEAALDWAMDHFQTDNPTPQPLRKPPPEAPQATTRAPKSKVKVDTPEKFYDACHRVFDIDGSQIDAEVQDYDLTTEEGRKQAWAAIDAVYGVKHEAVKQEAGLDQEKLFE